MQTGIVLSGVCYICQKERLMGIQIGMRTIVSRILRSDIGLVSIRRQMMI